VCRRVFQIVVRVVGMKVSALPAMLSTSQPATLCHLFRCMPCKTAHYNGQGVLFVYFKFQRTFRDLLQSPTKFYVPFYDAFRTSNYTASNIRLSGKWWLQKNLGSGDRVLIQVLSWYLLGGTEKNQENSQSARPIFFKRLSDTRKT